MRKTKAKKYIFLILIAGLFLLSTLLTTGDPERNLPAGVVGNHKPTGLSILFEAYEKAGLKVARTVDSPETLQVDASQIIFGNTSVDVYEASLLKWVNDGGQLIYLAPTGFSELQLDEGPGEKTQLIVGTAGAKIWKYTYGSGMIYSVEGVALDNRHIAKDSQMAYSLMKILGERSNTVFFNEYYLQGADFRETFWGSIPVWLRLLLFQGAIALVGWFILKGRRLGRAERYYEEEERSHNEFLYSVAAIYRLAGAYILVADSFYREIRNRMGKNRSNSDWLEGWEKEKLPGLEKAKEVQNFMESRQMKAGKKEYLRQIGLMEYLLEIIETRRETSWNKQKRES